MTSTTYTEKQSNSFTKWLLQALFISSVCEEVIKPHLQAPTLEIHLTVTENFKICMSGQMKYPHKIHLQTPLHVIVYTKHEETVALRIVSLSKKVHSKDVQNQM